MTVVKSNECQRKLYIVATPIGNLADISQRALDVLGEVDCVLCENTEHSLRLLRHFNIQPKSLQKLTDHESPERIQQYLHQVGSGGIALISDAGTPLMCDPGQRLVQIAHDQGFGVISVPGPCAVTAALANCPFPVVPFRFLGFLPRKSGERSQVMEALSTTQDTLVFFESPHRLISCLQDCQQAFTAQRQVFVVKELSKRFESFWHGSIQSVLDTLSGDSIQGEFVVVISGAEKRAADSVAPTIDLDECLQALLKNGISPHSIVEMVSPITEVRKNALYKRLLALKDGD
ncbi:MAG: 16S rRNA (cytidine(1402)-2'-O)-methyltransferase [Legionellales bacterium]|nr:16S rRNA (cytidine(1402)-2'-O)-methyltransferase [Legionellales bacterium]